MKSRTLMALAVAGTFACGGALAGGMHGKHHSSTEVMSPMSVSESAPWLANDAHSAGWTSQQSSSSIVAGTQESLQSDSFVGASSDIGGSGQGGFDSMSSNDTAFHGIDYYVLGEPIFVEYWLLGSDSDYGIGTSSSLSGSGVGGFDSSSSFSSDQSHDSMSSAGSGESFASTEQYLVWGPLSEADADDLMLIESDPGSASSVSLASLPEGYSLLTPIYDEYVDAGSFSDYQLSEFGSNSRYEISEFSPLSGDEDLAS